jgi:hypothetical protein
MSHTVVTSFSNAGFEQYGARFLETFNRYWPKTVTLYIYHEGLYSSLYDSHQAYDLLQVPECSHFIRRYYQDPLANGRVVNQPHPWKKKCADEGYNFRYDAFKFAKKVFAIYDAFKHVKTGKLFWVDADIVTFAPVTFEFLDSLLGDDYDTCYLGRDGRGHSECGFVGYNLDRPVTKHFIEWFAGLYISGDVFAYNEWHDSYVYDRAREYFKDVLRAYNIPSTGRGHVFVNSILGTVMDHLKGDRKAVGRSHRDEVVVPHNHSYWGQR